MTDGPPLLAIDQGTTSSRAIRFDGDGRASRIAQLEFTQHFPRPGWVEHDPEEIWSTTAAMCREAIERADTATAQAAAEVFLLAFGRPEVLDALSRLLGVSEFLWDDFLRMQYANLFPVVADVDALESSKSRAQLQAELEAELRPVHDGPQPPATASPAAERPRRPCSGVKRRATSRPRPRATSIA